MGDRSAYERRRREFRSRRPTHHCSECTSVLFADDEVCLECNAPRPAPGWAAVGRGSDPWLGRVCAERYLITRRIGQGASGNVYRAESLSIARQFAIKVINLDNHDSSVKAEHVEARLNREIGALGRLRNPHIVSFYDVLQVGDRAVALLMDLIDGRTLESVVAREGPLDLKRACRILRQIANGVHEAHEAGMIHRDLKPENVMLERLPAGDDFVHILDFGIVWREGDVRVTQGFLGTPLYASPEQAVGGELDRRADIYALGGMLFFMLTGRPPFFDNNVYKVLKAHVSSKVPRLEEIAPQRVFPEELETLVRRMLAKNPNDRPQTLAGVIYALDELVATISSSSPRGARATLAQSSAPAGGGQPADSAEIDPGRTVLSEASASEIEDEAAKDSTEDFFHSNERDSTGPKAAIFRRRKTSPSGAIAAEGTGSRGNSDLDEMRRQSGLYKIPQLTRQTRRDIRICACGGDEDVAILDGTRDVLVGHPARGYHSTFEVDAATPISALCLDGDWVYTGHRNGELIRWRAADGQAKTVHANVLASPVRAVACAGNGRWLVLGTAAGAVYLSRSSGQDAEPVRVQSGDAVQALAISGGRNLFAVARDNGTIGVFEISSPGTRVHQFDAERRVETMAFSNDGYLLAVVFADKELALYHVLTGALVMRNDAMVEQPLAVCFDRTNQLVGYCEVDGYLFGWDLHHNMVPQQPSIERS